MIPAVNQIFKFSGFSDRRRSIMLTTGLILFFGFGGYMLWIRHLKDTDDRISDLKAEVTRLTTSDSLHIKKLDERTENYLDYIEKIRRRDDSIAADDRRKYNELLKK